MMRENNEIFEESDNLEEQKNNLVNEVLEDLEENHNHSWYDELCIRNVDNLESIALKYRGNEITYRSMFNEMEVYASALKSLGITKDSEIPVCMSNTPELIYLLGAANLLGAKVNIFGKHYPSDYVTEIINGCKSEVAFIEENAYKYLKSAIEKTELKHIVMPSLRDSLIDDKDPYEKIDNQIKLFYFNIDFYKKNNCKILTIEDFKEKAKKYLESLSIDNDLDTEFTITYTSGSTNESKPKAIVHTNRSFITVARFHDKDLNGGYALNKFTFLAHIPPYSNTNLISCISDALMQGATLALEPVYDKDFFINSLIIYQPHYVAATKSFWINTAKKILYDDIYKNVKLKNLFLTFSCGESLEINEEKFINKALKKVKAGTKVTHTPFSIVKLSEAGGDCEHGSIFYTLFREYQNKKSIYSKRGEHAGLKPLPFVDVAVLDNEGQFIEPYHIGRIVADSPCTMKKYKNNPEATNNFFIKDAIGQTWGDMNLYGYIDSKNEVHIKGRMSKDENLYINYLTSKEILKDRENILSCEVVRDDKTGILVAHVEMNPNSNKKDEFIIYNADQRCENLKDHFNTEVYYRIRNNRESYPLTGSGKRDVRALKKEGLTEKCVRPIIKKEGKLKLAKYKLEEEKVKVKKKMR